MSPAPSSHASVCALVYSTSAAPPGSESAGLPEEEGPEEEVSGPFTALFASVLRVTAQLVGPEDAAGVAVAFWSLRHGFVGLERGGHIGAPKPRAGLEMGLEARLTGFRSPTP